MDAGLPGYSVETGIDNWLLTVNSVAQPAAPGDSNLDGVVDDDDLSLLLAHWGQDRTADPDGGWGKGEFNRLIFLRCAIDRWPVGEGGQTEADKKQSN